MRLLLLWLHILTLSLHLHRFIWVFRNTTSNTINSGLITENIISVKNLASAIYIYLLEHILGLPISLSGDVSVGCPTSVHRRDLLLTVDVNYTSRILYFSLVFISLYKLFSLSKRKVYVWLRIFLYSYLRRRASSGWKSIIMKPSINLWWFWESVWIINDLIINVILILFAWTIIFLFQYKFSQLVLSRKRKHWLILILGLIHSILFCFLGLAATL